MHGLLMVQRGRPHTVVSGNGTELTSLVILALAPGSAGRVALHGAWQADAERVRGEL
jgi:hypothetical protein